MHLYEPMLNRSYLVGKASSYVEILYTYVSLESSTLPWTRRRRRRRRRARRAGRKEEEAQKKKDQHRFDGKGKFDTSQVPTYDLIQGKETIA